MSQHRRKMEAHGKPAKNQGLFRFLRGQLPSVTNGTVIVAAAVLLFLRVAAPVHAACDATPPSAVTSLTAFFYDSTQTVRLSWVSPGNDGFTGNLPAGSSFFIQLSRVKGVNFSTSSTPTGAFDVVRATSGVAPYTWVGTTVGPLLPDTTYYVSIWVKDECNWSSLSNTVTFYHSPFNPVEIVVDGVGGGLYNSAVVWGDFDRDGDLDLLISGSNGSNQVRMYKNNGGDGTFDGVEIDVEPTAAERISGVPAAADFDGDGDLDVLLSGQDSSGRQIRIYRNDGDGTFDGSAQIEVEPTSADRLAGYVAWGDYDSDGDPDILVSGQDASLAKQLRVYRNRGDGTFDRIDVESVSADRVNGRVAWFDYDRDGDLDILVSGTDGVSARQLRVYRNKGDGTFDGNEVDVEPTAGDRLDGYFAVGDYDNDGDLDIAITGSDGSSAKQMRVYVNGNGSFDGTRVDLEPTAGERIVGDLAWGDFDNDGDLDVLVKGVISAPPFELRVYRNNGNGAFDGTQIEVNGVGGGLVSGLAWGDFDRDGDLDIVNVGYVSSPPGNTRIFRNLYDLVRKNTPPSAPTGLSAAFAYNPGGESTATFKWSPASDNGTGATPENTLMYDLQVSTDPNFGAFVVPGFSSATPMMGNYLRPPKIYDGNTKHGVVLTSTDPWNAQLAPYGLRTNTTYYYRVFTIDSALAFSPPSATGVLNTGVAPAAITSLSALFYDGTQAVQLSWVAPGDDGATGVLSSGCSYFVQVSSVATVSWSTETVPSGAFNVLFATSGVSPYTWVGATVGPLTPDLTYYFRVWLKDEGGNWSSISNGATFYYGPYDPVQIELGGALGNGRAVWGDVDRDGDLDIVVMGTNNGTDAQLRLRRNNGNGTFAAAEDVEGAADLGLQQGGLSLGDFDGDGDLDILAAGVDSSGVRQLRVYKNNGPGTFDPNQIEVAGLNLGLYETYPKWGDFDNDGDLDVLVNGYDGSASQLRVYRTTHDANGYGFDPVAIEVNGANAGVARGNASWGDFDGDGDLDILASGWENSTGQLLKVWKNNGNGTFNATEINVDAAGADGGLQSGQASWGDYDNDGDLDILVSGKATNGDQDLRVYSNNGNGTFNGTPLYVGGANGGLQNSGSSWADFDNDGDLDILAVGTSAVTGRQIRLHRNLGGGAFDNTRILVDGENGGLSKGFGAEIAAGDFDNDGDLDILVAGTDIAGDGQLRVYKNLYNLVRTNSPPSAPTGLSATFDYGGTGSKVESTATFKWSAGTDSETPENGLTYDLQVSTDPNFGSFVIPGLSSTTPMMGNYNKPPKIYDGGTRYGVVLTSTNLKNQANPPYGLRLNSTYYYRVYTIDAGLKYSAASSVGTLYTSTQAFSEFQIEVNGVNGGLGTGSSAVWGDYDKDGDLDILAMGMNDSSNYKMRIYRSTHDANGYGFNPAEYEPDGAAGLAEGNAAFGDFDNDGDLDILAVGTNEGTNGDLRIWKATCDVNGCGYDPAQIDVEPTSTERPFKADAAFGDFDNDGDLDIAVIGIDEGGNRRFRVYKNIGGGSYDGNSPLLPTGVGLRNGSVAWGDYDGDGDLDILAMGNSSSGRELQIAKNNGNGTFGATINVESTADDRLAYGNAAFGDFDNDGDLDILAVGNDNVFASNAPQLRVYRNNGGDSFTKINVDGAGGGLGNDAGTTAGAYAAWGDYDGDGDLDILAVGIDSSGNRQLRVYRNNGDGTFDSAQIEVDGLNGGLVNGRVSWGDYDQDGDLDILVTGTDGSNRQLRVYKNNYSGVNQPPTPPTDIAAEFIYVGGGAESTATFKWGAGWDLTTPENGLMYDLEVSTSPSFAGAFVIPRMSSTTPMMGNYLKPPKIYDGGTRYGTVLTSTSAWKGTSAPYGLRVDSTYYWRVYAIDAGLAFSPPSATGILYTSTIAPSAVTTLTALFHDSTQTLRLSWMAPGEDGTRMPLMSGASYFIQVSSVATVAWSTQTTPAGAYNVIFATSGVSPFQVVGTTIGSLTPDLTYYFRIWTRDTTGRWSDISNGATFYHSPFNPAEV